MTAAPLPPRCELGGAADIKSGQEPRLYGISATQSQSLVRLRRQRHVEQIHRLGARIVFELLDELDRHHGLGADLDRRLERYSSVEPDILAALGGDRFAAAPLRLVGGGDR
jgi:hypothetical protein